VVPALMAFSPYWRREAADVGAAAGTAGADARGAAGPDTSGA
jgi:hypothetical protein